MRRRTAAGQSDLASEIAEGAELIRRARERAHGADAALLEAALDRLASSQAKRHSSTSCSTRGSNRPWPGRRSGAT